MTVTSSAVPCCPKCGGRISPEAPQGLCPRCLLAQVSIPTEGGGGATIQPPNLEELARAFPHLEIIELIGRGGMGFVYKARQPKLERFVALKILPDSLAVDPAFTDRFTREGRMLARLSHPNIVAVHDFGLAHHFYYLLMEYVDGVNLRQAMQAGRFTPEQALAVVPKICEALQYAHNEGVLHRDIKPENILLDARGRVKIADFGIAKLLGDPQNDPGLTASGSTMGTPHYMAPEQLERPSSVDHRADIYSLGVVFYEMLTGELPLGCFAPPSHKCGVDPRVDDVVLHALEKEPGRRSQSATELKTQLETIRAHPATVRVGSPPATPAPAWIKRLGILFLVLGTLAFVPSLLSLQTNSFSFHGGSLLVFTGIALLTRHELWRLVALFLDALVLLLSAFGFLVLLGLKAGGQLPPHLNMGVGVPGMPNHFLLGSFFAAVEMAGFVASVIVLCRADVKALFAPTSRVAGLPSWASVSMVVLAILAVIQGLMFAGAYWTRTILPQGDAPEYSITRNAGPSREGETPSREGSTKTVEFYGVTNDARSITISSHADLPPGESLTALVGYSDGRIVNALTTFSTIRQANGRQFYTGLAWPFPEPFNSEDVAMAARQIRREKEHRPLLLRDGMKMALFAVTNATGGSMEGYVLYTRVPAEAGHTNAPRATVALERVSVVGTAGLIADYALNQPPGYALEAAVKTSAGSGASARSNRGGSQHGWHHHAYWSFNRGLTEDLLAGAKKQVDRLAQAGPLQVSLDQPQLVFSITNSAGEVCQGWFELVGPSTASSK